MATTRIMPLHIGKGRTESRAISDIIDYVANPQKTDNGKLITGYGCDSRTADAEFLLAKRQYITATGRVRGADDVIAYHVRQSFKPGEITPEEANCLGVEFAKRFTKGKDFSIRKRKTDRVDAFKLAMMYRTKTLRPSQIPQTATRALRQLCRHRAELLNDVSSYKNRLTALLDQTFPGYDKVFSDVGGVTSCAVLARFPTPTILLVEEESELVEVIFCLKSFLRICLLFAFCLLLPCKIRMLERRQKERRRL